MKGPTMKLDELKQIFKAGSLVTMLLFIQCAALQEFTSIQKPTLNLEDVQLTGLSLEKINLVFAVAIENPNSFAATLSGFDYDFKLANAPFLNGKQDKKLTIAGGGKSTLEVPLSLKFSDIYQTYQSLKNQDSTDYQISLGLVFDLPVLGKTRIPVSKSGNLPLVKIPKIKLGSLKLKNLSLTRADLDLILELENPNPFSLALDKLNYELKINNSTWASGLTQQKLQIQNKEKSEILLPLSLNLFEMGRTVYGLITGDRSLNYQLGGGMVLDSPISVMAPLQLTFDESGKLNIIK
ncbi:MAG TPA: hypothetical protein ENN22_03130 [bacterium]|nr:hypothetical protein [bacterium]